MTTTTALTPITTVTFGVATVGAFFWWRQSCHPTDQSRGRDYSQKFGVRFTPSLLQTVACGAGTISILVYELKYKYSITSTGTTSNFASTISNYNLGPIFNLNNLGTYLISSAAIYGLLSHYATKTRKSVNSIISNINNILTHPITIKTVQCIGYAWPFYYIARSAYQRSLGNGINSCNDHNNNNNSLTWVWAGLGAWIGSLYTMDLIYIAGLRHTKRRVFQYINLNRLVHISLVIKASAYGVWLYDRYNREMKGVSGVDSSDVDNINGFDHQIDEIRYFISNYLSPIDLAYGSYSLFNVLHVTAYKLFPTKLDDYDLMVSKIFHSIEIAFVSLGLIGINSIAGDKIMDMIGINLNGSKRIFMNELCFYLCGVFVFEALSKYGINITKIENGLYISNIATAMDKNSIDKYNINNIVQLCGKKHKNKIEHDNVRYKIVRIEDRSYTRLIDYFEETNEFIEQSIKNGENVLVHCQYGVSRSSTIVVAYLIGKLGYSWDEAIDIMNIKREQFQPNAGYMRQLKEYYDKVAIVKKD